VFEASQSPSEQLAREIRRVADRLRSMPFSRLDAAVAVVQGPLSQVARATCEHEGTAFPGLEDVPKTAWGDVAAVLGQDVLNTGSPDLLATASQAYTQIRRDLP
jgi:hypothetical protein